MQHLCSFLLELLVVPGNIQTGEKECHSLSVDFLPMLKYLKGLMEDFTVVPTLSNTNAARMAATGIRGSKTKMKQKG